MIVGAHSIIYSKNPEADRAFLKDVLELPHVDMGWGMLAQISLPGGGKLSVYQPRHARPRAIVVRKKTKEVASRTRKGTKRGGGT